MMTTHFEALPVFIVGLLIMLFFSIWFFFNRQRTPGFQNAFLVTSITSLSYLLLVEGSVAWISPTGTPIYYTRWLFYIASCSLLMLTICKILKVEKKAVPSVVILNSLVMLSGAVAALIESPIKWMIFGLGLLFFAGQLILLYQKAPDNGRTRMITYYILFGWALFPVVFIFAPEGLDLISNFMAAILYLILDIFTKIVFYLQLGLRKKQAR